MNRSYLHYLRLGTLVLGLSVSLAHAGKITDEIASGDAVVAILNGESTLFADAFRAKIAGSSLAKRGKSVTWNNVRAATHGPTVARMEYTYTKGDLTFTRIYHARSGPAMEVTLSRFNFAPPGDTSSSGPSGPSGTESEGSKAYEITDGDIAKDIAERVYYPADTPFSVRVPNLPSNGSIIQSRLIKGTDNHKADAELKIFRQIEKDINEDIVTVGGTLKGYVSKAMCESCGPAAEDLAEAFDIKGAIYQLVEPGAKASSTNDPDLLASYKSSENLKKLRKEYASAHFKRDAVTNPMERSRIGVGAIERIEAEETRATPAEPCGD